MNKILIFVLMLAAGQLAAESFNSRSNPLQRGKRTATSKKKKSKVKKNQPGHNSMLAGYQEPSAVHAKGLITAEDMTVGN